MFKSDKSSSIKLYSSDSDGETTERLAKLKLNQQQAVKKTTASPSPPLARPKSGYRQSDSENSRASKTKKNANNYSDDYEDDFEDSASKASKSIRNNSRNSGGGKDRVSSVSSKNSDAATYEPKRGAKVESNKSNKYSAARRSGSSKSRSPSSGRETPKGKERAVNRKVDHFSRPRAREESPSSSSSDERRKKSQKSSSLEKGKPLSKPRSNSLSSGGSSSSHTGFLHESNDKSSKVAASKSNNNVKFDSKPSSEKKGLYDSDSDSARRHQGKSSSTPKKGAATVKSSLKSPRSPYSSSSSSRSRSPSSSQGSDLKSKSKDKRSSAKPKKYDNDDSDDSQRTLSPTETPIRVNIERKPPIDKSSWNKKHSRSINFDRPNDSGSDHEPRSSQPAKSKSNRNLNETFDLESPANSSNEMTDVSPLPSPKKPPRHHHRQSGKESSGGGSGTGGGSHFMRSRYEDEKDEDKLDMDSFYKTLSSDINSRMDLAFKSIRSGRSSSKDLNTSVDSVGQRRNRIMNVEDENQRLLKKIMKKKASGSHDRPVRITSSALNRQREQQRIEKENQLLYKRLTSVKASNFLKKEEQMKDYERNFGFNIMKYAKMTSSTPTSMMHTAHNMSANTSLLTADGVNSVLSTKRSAKPSESNNHSRISSANYSVVSSAKGHHFSLTSLEAKAILKQAGFGGSKQRPEWNDRW